MIIDVTEQLRLRGTEKKSFIKGSNQIIDLYTQKELQDKSQAQEDHDALLRRIEEQSHSRIIPFGFYIGME